VLPLPLPVARDQFWRERSVLERSVLEGNRMKRLTSILTITCMTIRVFLKRHFVKNRNLHPATQRGGARGERVQGEGLNRQVWGVAIDT